MYNKENSMDEINLFKPHGSKEYKMLEDSQKKKVKGKEDSETILFHPHGSKEFEKLESSSKKKKEAMGSSW